MTMTQILLRPQPIAGGRRADAAEGEAFRFLNPARRDTLCEVQIAAPEMTSSRWQKPDRTSEAVALP